MTHPGPAPERDFVLRGEHVALDALLKATGLAASGGHAKQLVADGRVRVDGAVETRRGRKLRPGMRVALEGADASVQVVAAPTDRTAGTDGRGDP